MAYLSDIDLATLHKKRLDEKNDYKLSWYNRRLYDEETSMKIEKHKVKSKVLAVEKTTALKSKAKTSTIKQALADNKSVRNGTKDKSEVTAYQHNANVYDEGCFSSSTLNRRRSGTWP